MVEMTLLWKRQHVKTKLKVVSQFAHIFFRSLSPETLVMISVAIQTGSHLATEVGFPIGRLGPPLSAENHLVSKPNLEASVRRSREV